MSIYVHHEVTWDRFCLGKTTLYVANYTPSTLVSKCKQTITAPRHVKSSFSSWDTVSPCSQSVRLQTKHFSIQWKGHTPRSSKGIVWFIIFSSEPWLALLNGNIHSVSVKRDTESLQVITRLCDIDSLICGIVSFLGHTIAREPLSHEETWNSPCGKDGWLTHIYCTTEKKYQGQDRCQAIHHKTMG